MSDHRDIASEARTLTLQAAVFRALRDHGLEPELSDTLGRAVPPAETLEEQSRRIMLSVGIAADLRSTIGLDRFERAWVNTVVDATCRRHERQRQPRPVARVATNAATATTVVFRRRIGGGHA
jgi:hypothetical protein